MAMVIRQVGYRLAIWLVTEILLSFLGLDDLADYSEFLFEDSALANSPPAATLVIMVGANSEKPYHATTTHDATGWQPG